jgi:alkaline phosphatase
VHSGEDVILTAAGPGSERVHGQLDNTEVFRIVAEALGLAPSVTASQRTELKPR